MVDSFKSCRLCKQNNEANSNLAGKDLRTFQRVTKLIYNDKLPAEVNSDCNNKTNPAVHAAEQYNNLSTPYGVLSKTCII